jgi:hypothetical protein
MSYSNFAMSGRYYHSGSHMRRLCSLHTVSGNKVIIKLITSAQLFRELSLTIRRSRTTKNGDTSASILNPASFTPNAFWTVYKLRSWLFRLRPHTSPHTRRKTHSLGFPFPTRSQPHGTTHISVKPLRKQQSRTIPSRSKSCSQVVSLLSPSQSLSTA